MQDYHKRLLAAGKENGCEIIQRWIKGVRNHLFWSALSTKQGSGDLIVAKWTSIIRHIADKHEGHPNKLFPKCAHGELEQREYIKIGKEIRIRTQDITFFASKFGITTNENFLPPLGTHGYDRLYSIVMNTRILKDIKNCHQILKPAALKIFIQL